MIKNLKNSPVDSTKCQFLFLMLMPTTKHLTKEVAFNYIPFNWNTYQRMSASFRAMNGEAIVTERKALHGPTA